MKKNILFFAAFLLITGFNLNAKNWTSINNNGETDTKVKIVSSTENETVINFQLNSYNLKPVSTPQGEAFIVEAPDLTSILKTGAPDLSKFARSIIIPDYGKMEIEVLSSDFIELYNIDIAPSKGNFTRDIDPASVPYTYGNEYDQNEFYPSTTVGLREPYILRDHRGQTILFYPFKYNPVTKTLRIFTNITVKVNKTSDIGINEFKRKKTVSNINDEFNKIYKSHFLNYSNSLKYTPLEEGTPGNMLIICYGSYMSDMQAFVDWKREKGMATEMVDVSTIGSTASQIKTYVENYYNTNGLVYLLLVGDDAQVTSSSTGAGDSDVDYGYLLGSDSYAEIFVGRFSAESVAHVQTQLARTIEYEKTPVPGDWWTNSSGIGSDQGPGDDGEMDYDHLRNMHTDLLGFTYSNCFEYFDGSQGGGDAAGNPTPSDIATVTNAGNSLMLYTGHGSDNSWVSSGFSNTDVNALTNNNKYPFIFSVACVNGNFTGGTCFAESWLRAENGGQPAGAIATFMSTINQSWNPPMNAQDEMVDIMVEIITGNIKRTFGGITFNGTFRMNDEDADFAMTDTWTIFGDPSVVVRTKSPMSLTATHLPTINLGVTNFTVNCSVEGALVSLTNNEPGGVEILGTGYINGGTVDITIPAFIAPDTMLVTITEFNYAPYIAEVLVISSTGPYVIYNSKVINDPTGNNNNLADYNEDISLDIILENVGVAQATNVNATISTSNIDVTITDNTQGFGTINSSATASESNAYAMSIADGIADQTNVLFDMSITDGIDTWPSSFSVLCNAPDIEQNYLNIDDSATGDDDGILDAGETVDINIEALNIGHANSVSSTCVLTSTSPYVTINSSSITLGALNTGNNYPSVHNITISGATPMGSSVDLVFTVTASSYSDVMTINLPVGLMIEDWESNTFTSYEWNNTSAVPWTITSVDPYEGSNCAISGAISDDQISELIIDLDVLTDDSLTFFKKVSCELGEDWFGTYLWYDFLEFQIDGTEQGKWDGEVSWSKEAYLVTSGNHTLKWIYSKDVSAVGGQDCAWVDYIKLPAHSTSNIINYTYTDIENLKLSVYPNPVTSNATINFTLPHNSDVQLCIFNILGENINNLINTNTMSKGNYNVYFNADNLNAGMYWCKLRVNNKEFVNKFIIFK